MATYAIGDVQGCYDELQALLEKINFDVAKDQLWFVGDLVNRGPKSLEVLRFIKKLANAKVVLGNHDLHLLALASGFSYSNHTLHPVLTAPDCDEIIAWLKQLPLLYHDEKLNYVMVHAGIYPFWDLAQAKKYARELENALLQEPLPELLKNLYGDLPEKWHDDLIGYERLRFICNVFTRMRFSTPDGKLEFKSVAKVGSQPAGYLPWFQIPKRQTQNINIIFGHWAALEGKTNAPNLFALDTGCVWGRALTAMRLEDRKYFSVTG